MYNDYLIPANTKRGQLILGWFRPFDLALVSSGILITLLMLAILPISSLVVTLIAIAPAFITLFLVMPIPYYHNMLNVIKELYEFLTNRQTYRWKGWCYRGKQKH